MYQLDINVIFLRMHRARLDLFIGEEFGWSYFIADQKIDVDACTVNYTINIRFFSQTFQKVSSCINTLQMRCDSEINNNWKLISTEH